jgi:hypothetical protein
MLRPELGIDGRRGKIHLKRSGLYWHASVWFDNVRFKRGAIADTPKAAFNCLVRAVDERCTPRQRVMLRRG